MRRKVYFRADGGSEIGLGHVVRLLSIVDMVKADFDCIFLIKNPSDAILALIAQTCTVFSLQNDLDLIAESEYISTKILDTPSVLILDGYHFSAEYQKKLKENSNCKLICIDDLTPIQFWADVLINQAGGISPKSYQAALYTKFCLGSKYAMLRQEFLMATKKERVVEKTTNLFICFGGADPSNFSKEVLSVALSLKKFDGIHLVLGNAYQHLDELEILLSNQTNTFLHRNLSAAEIVTLMQSCNLAVVSASGISYEAAAVGIGLIVIRTADNQQGIYKFLTTNGLALGLSTLNGIELQQQLTSLTPEKINRQILEQRIFFKDSTPFFRKIVHRLFLEFEITLRPAVPADMLLYFDWANDPEARQNAINPEPISLETHKCWFFKKIADKNALLYCFEYHETPLGRLRFDVIDDHYVISYSIDKQFRGQGFGELIVKKALEEIAPHFDKEKYVIQAEVKTDNIASQKVFEHLGFEKNGLNVYSENVTVLCYEKS